jgi:membrane protein
MKRMADVGPVGAVVDTAGRLAPYALVFAAFLVAYLLIPNTKVRWRSAAFGAAIGAALWLATGIAFARMGASSTQYDAIYSGFAIVLLFIIWMYLCWFILLFGAQVSFYHQNPRLMTRYSFQLQLGGRLREKLALSVMLMVGEHYLKQRPPWTLGALSDRLRVTGDALGTVVARLRDAGLLLGIDDEEESYVPARDMSTIHLREIIAAVRDPGQREDHPEHYVKTVERVDRLMDEIERTVAATLGERTLRDLVEGERPPHA